MKRRSQLARSPRQLQRSDATSRQHGAGVATRRPRGLKTRRAILRRAVNIASIEGLEGLTLGKLATQLRISKSGLFAHFGSKEDLQCAVVEEAREIFTDRVIRPAFEFRGLKRLYSLCDNWLQYAEEKVFPGGCFFSAASLEFDDRPGRVRDQIVGSLQKWLDRMVKSVREAQDAGEIRKNADPHQLIFEIQALAMGANWASRLFHDHGAFRRIRRSILERIDQVTEHA
jgi:AcrR family transcriptional regulator